MGGCAGGPAGAGGTRSGTGGADGRGSPAAPRVSLVSYVPSLSMNPCPLTSQVSATVPASNLVVAGRAGRLSPTRTADPGPPAPSAHDTPAMSTADKATPATTPDRRMPHRARRA
ncbi:hypothetical protein SLA_5549 [Streptomyces laurentii]|uniref:Uncharacterized protein n=1 Tax=Streptomyces laurentii TaxID=39478 RepID=A0A169P4A0_STRLU|nr:hypothetical protein SLA_5549 [Streptomyces laurentii]